MTGNDAQKRVTDLTYLRQLSNGDQVFIVEMVELFYLQAPAELELLWQMFEQGRMVEVRRVAHKLKSSVLLVGAEPMRDILVRIEHLSLDTGHEQEIKRLYEELLRMNGQAIAELQAQVKK